MKARAIARVLLALFYLVAGIAHLRSPAGFLKITPSWVPWPDWVVWATGWCEVTGAIALLFIPRMRRAAGIGLALYALCVWPANINHAVNGVEVGGLPSSWWYHGPRLLFQPVLIWLAFWVGGVTDWPWRKRG